MMKAMNFERFGAVCCHEMFRPSSQWELLGAYLYFCSSGGSVCELTSSLKFLGQLFLCKALNIKVRFIHKLHLSKHAMSH